MKEDNDYFDDDYEVPAEQDKSQSEEESAEERERREVEKLTIDMKHNWLRPGAAVAGVIVVVIALVWLWLYLFSPAVSMQQQMGYVNEMKCEGLVFKTFEGKLLTYGLLYDSVPEPTTEFDFSVENDSIVRDILLLQKTGKKVAVTYKEYRVALPWRGNSPRIVTAIEER